RPGHFRGVATVVAILLNTVRADRAYFGEKDFQQLQIVHRMHRDLQLPGAIVASPTVRDRDGLALSSRNSRLSSEGRATARAIPRALAAIAARAQAGASSAAELLAPGRTILSAPGIDLDYLALVDAETLEPTACLGSSSRVLVAAEVDSVRLIDNIALPARQEQTPDHGRPQPA
ncbi:MAG: pantoate--beta-alanine ligase, partial [Thermomicrobiales bacterium]|nr:pantoate--beta-alanine ligase [Thermomicrobiales bacterium]